jgi:hypothetical protein
MVAVNEIKLCNEDWLPKISYTVATGNPNEKIKNNTKI